MRQSLVNLIIRMWRVMPDGAKAWAFMNDGVADDDVYKNPFNDSVYRMCERIAALFNKKPQS